MLGLPSLAIGRGAVDLGRSHSSIFHHRRLLKLESESQRAGGWTPIRVATKQLIRDYTAWNWTGTVVLRIKISGNCSVVASDAVSVPIHRALGRRHLKIASRIHEKEHVAIA